MRHHATAIGAALAVKLFSFRRFASIARSCPHIRCRDLSVFSNSATHSFGPPITNFSEVSLSPRSPHFQKQQEANCPMARPDWMMNSSKKEIFQAVARKPRFSPNGRNHFTTTARPRQTSATGATRTVRDFPRARITRPINETDHAASQGIDDRISRGHKLLNVRDRLVICKAPIQSS